MHMSKSFGLINEKVDSFYRHVVRCQFVHYSFNGSERGSCAFRRGSTKLRVTLRRKTYLVLQLIVEVSNLTLCLFHLFL